MAAKRRKGTLEGGIGVSNFKVRTLNPQVSTLRANEVSGLTGPAPLPQGRGSGALSRQSGPDALHGGKYPYQRTKLGKYE